MGNTKNSRELGVPEFMRLVNNFYQRNNLNVPIDRVGIDIGLSNYLANEQQQLDKRFKVAVCFICVNEPYWEYAKQVMDSARQYLLPGHDVDFLLWTDMPKEHAKDLNATLFEIEPETWPMPTLLRYSVYLQQEELLKKYDYIFHCDIDMLFVNIVGDEILTSGITAAQHPMYALDKSFWPPYEPNMGSEAYIPRPGMVIQDKGQPRFMPLYFAGGFQGGKSDVWIKAMKDMKKMINKDLGKNYIPIWNDESIFNRYLFDNPPTQVLTPSYIYPDSLIEEYYVPRWGVRYEPRIVTLTKKHTLKPLTPEEQAQLTRLK